MSRERSAARSLFTVAASEWMATTSVVCQEPPSGSEAADQVEAAAISPVSEAIRAALTAWMSPAHPGFEAVQERTSEGVTSPEATR